MPRQQKEQSGSGEMTGDCGIPTTASTAASLRYKCIRSSFITQLFYLLDPLLKFSNQCWFSFLNLHFVNNNKDKIMDWTIWNIAFDDASQSIKSVSVCKNKININNTDNLNNLNYIWYWFWLYLVIILFYRQPTRMGKMRSACQLWVVCIQLTLTLCSR